MNLIETGMRNRLAVSTIADLLFIKLNGPSLELWDARSYVLHWLRTHNSEDITANKSNKVTEELSESDKAFYKILK